MAISQNAKFTGQAPVDAEFEHPTGASIARLLESNLGKQKYNVSEFDNWRDCGWQIFCSTDNVRLEIQFSEIGNSEWLLQVAPANIPGIIGRLFGKTQSANPDDCYVLAKTVHEVLSSSGEYSNFKWCWDGFPDEKNSTSEPIKDSSS